MLNELEKNEISPEVESSGNRQGDFSGSKNALPLAMGTLVEAIDLLQDMLQGEKKEESSNDHQGRYIAVGLASRSIEKVGRGIRSTVKTSGRLASLLMLPGRVVAGSRPFRPARNRLISLLSEVGRRLTAGRKRDRRSNHTGGNCCAKPSLKTRERLLIGLVMI